MVTSRGLNSAYWLRGTSFPDHTHLRALNCENSTSNREHGELTAETSHHKLSLEAYLHNSLASEIGGKHIRMLKTRTASYSSLPPHHSPFPYMVLDKNNGHSNLWSRSRMEKEVVKQLREQIKIPSTSGRKHGSQRAWPPQPYSRDQLVANSGKRQFQDCFWPLMPLLFWTPGELSSTAELHSIRSFIPFGLEPTSQSSPL